MNQALDRATAKAIDMPAETAHLFDIRREEADALGGPGGRTALWALHGVRKAGHP